MLCTAFASSICSAPNCRANALRCAEGAARRRTMVLQAKNTNIEHGAISFSLTPRSGRCAPRSWPLSRSQRARGACSARLRRTSKSKTLPVRSHPHILPHPHGSTPSPQARGSCFQRRPPCLCSRTTLRSTACTPALPPMSHPSLFNPTAASQCLSSLIARLLFPASSPLSRPPANTTYLLTPAH